MFISDYRIEYLYLLFLLLVEYLCICYMLGLSAGILRIYFRCLLLVVYNIYYCYCYYFIVFIRLIPPMTIYTKYQQYYNSNQSSISYLYTNQKSMYTSYYFNYILNVFVPSYLFIFLILFILFFIIIYIIV